MFDITDMRIGRTFGKGAFSYDGGINGAKVMIMESTENVEKVIKDFRHLYYLYNKEIDPNELLHRIYEKHNINEDLDFTQSDIDTLNKELNAIVRRSY